MPLTRVNSRESRAALSGNAPRCGCYGTKGRLVILTIPVGDGERRIEAGLLRIDRHHYPVEPGGGVTDVRPPHTLLTFICESSNRIYGNGWEVTLEAGDALLIPPRTRFSAEFGSQRALTVINIQIVFKPAARARLFELFPECVRASEDTTELRRLLENCLLARRNGDEGLAELEFGSVLLQLAKMKRAAGQPRRSRTVQRALDYVLEHCAERIGRKEIATACGVSPSHLSELVKHETGVTLTAQIQRARVARARHLMQTTSKNFSQIAADLNMDLYTFSRLFKKVTGASPSDYCKAAEFGRIPTS